MPHDFSDRNQPSACSARFHEASENCAVPCSGALRIEEKIVCQIPSLASLAEKSLRKKHQRVAALMQIAYSRHSTIRWKGRPSGRFKAGIGYRHASLKTTFEPVTEAARMPASDAFR